MIEDNHKDDRFDFELRRALLEDTPQPDAEKAFLQFKERCGKQTAKWQVLKPYIAVAAAACIAALCYLVLPFGKENGEQLLSYKQHQLEKMGNVVFMADDDRKVISVSVDGKMIELAANRGKSQSGFVSVAEADMEQVLGWKNGQFYFDGQSLREIMMEMGRWYNMSIVFASNQHIGAGCVPMCQPSLTTRPTWCRHTQHCLILTEISSRSMPPRLTTMWWLRIPNCSSTWWWRTCHSSGKPSIV